MLLSAVSVERCILHPRTRRLGMKVLTFTSRISDVNTDSIRLWGRIRGSLQIGTRTLAASADANRRCTQRPVSDGDIWHITCYLLIRVRDCGNPAVVSALAKWPTCEMRETTPSPAQAGPIRRFFGRARPTKRIAELLGMRWWRRRP